MALNISTGTNGGANRFFDKGGEIFVAGSDVSGKQKVTADLLAELWGAELLRQGDVTSDEGKPTLESDATIVRISGLGTNGTYRFDFDSEKEASNFLKFLNEVKAAGALDDML